MKSILYASLLTLSLIVCGAAAQSERGLEKGKGHHKEASYYDQGLAHGRDDAAHHRDRHYHLRLDREDDRREYQRGYDEGYRSALSSRDRDHDARDTRGAGSYGGRPSGSMASRMGYEDGLNDGRKDKATGHSFRPTQGDNYKSATRGYSSAYGSKDQYKQEYREAYAKSYQQGYYGR